MGGKGPLGNRRVTLDGGDGEPGRAGGDEAVVGGVPADLCEDLALQSFIVGHALLHQERPGHGFAKGSGGRQRGQAPLRGGRVGQAFGDQEAGCGGGAFQRRLRSPFARVVQPHCAPVRREQPGPTRSRVARADDGDGLPVHDDPLEYVERSLISSLLALF